MNVLFYTSFEVSPQKGGTERITCRIAEGLKKIYNVKCFSAYSCPIGQSFKRYKFDGSIYVPSFKNNIHKLVQFIIDNEIDIIINQGAFSLTRPLKEILPSKVKIIFCHHFSPGWDENFCSLRTTVRNLRKQSNKLEHLIKLILFPIIKFRYNYKLPRLYNECYIYADKVVLLSEKFKVEYMKYACIQNDFKFVVIPNSLSFNTFFNMNMYHQKQKKVLIVSRLEEVQKRISLALKIWEIIEKDVNLEDWTLSIVGHGEDEKQYKNFVQKQNLHRIVFKGACDPKDFYRESSIFMLTSKSEGWGLTLTEAQQFGCVPLAFNSYSSLTDIIENEQNGIIIPYPNIGRYAIALKKVMLNDKYRQKLAEQCVKSSKRFQIQNICQSWYHLCVNIMNG